MNFGTEPGQPAGKFAIVRVDPKVGAHMPYFFFQLKRMNCNCESMKSVLLLQFSQH